MSTDKQLWLLAGGNGSGKSTFYRTQLQPLGMPFVNADVLAKELYPGQAEVFSYEAAKLAEQIRLQMLQDGRTFCFETVFSHPSKIDFVARAKALNYEVILVFVHLDCVELNYARVEQRVEEGGHFVPPSKVSERIPRTLENVKQALPLCDQVYFLDNSRYDHPFRQVAVIKSGVLHLKQPSLPLWLKQLVDDFLSH